jgi:hypothetical protein
LERGARGEGEEQDVKERRSMCNNASEGQEEGETKRVWVMWG